MIHLLKSPFCVHPKTGKICVPIPFSDITDVERFDFETVPTYEQLAANNEAAITDFNDYINYFRDFVKKLHESEN